MTPKNRFGFVCLWWRRNDSDPRGKVKGFMSVTGIPVCPESALRSNTEPRSVSVQAK